ncbi:MAG TPA: hypothetical protein VFY21_08720 [Xanthobacteraceae bacterium]|nr:hypothetical protein [Xanthobacteraceae bacterium]
MHDPVSHAHVHARTEVTLAPSLLRLSAVQRLAIAVVLSALLWVTVAWALMDISA